MSIPTWAKVTGSLVGAGALGFLGYKLYKKEKENKQINTFNKSTIQINPDGTLVKTSKLKGGTTVNPSASINLNEIAETIGKSLGTAYSWFDPRHATENEEGAAIAVLKVPKPLIPQLSKIYEDKYKSNLQSDLQSLLDEKWNDVRQLFI